MNLLTAFKICPDLDSLAQGDLIIEEEVRVNVYFLPNILNCYDESALELSLRVRDSRKADENETQLSTITIGNEQCVPTLQTLQALGFEKAVHVDSTDEDVRFSQECIAQTIANYVKDFPQDIVLLGKEAPLGNGACVPQMLAEKIGYPLIANVIDIIRLDDKSVTVHCTDGSAIIEQEIALPCVLSVGYPLAACDTANVLPQSLSIPDRSRESYISQHNGFDAFEDILNHSLQKRLDTL